MKKKLKIKQIGTNANLLIAPAIDACSSLLTLACFSSDDPEFSCVLCLCLHVIYVQVGENLNLGCWNKSQVLVSHTKSFLLCSRFIKDANE